MDNSGTAPAKDDEWPQEPEGFHNIKFGSTKEEAEKHVTFERYAATDDGLGFVAHLDTPYPTRGVTHFSFGGADITASLIFTPADGCHCFEGIFPMNQFAAIKTAFLSLYGQPHEVASEDHPTPEHILQRVPEEEQQYYNQTIQILRWYSSRVFICLVSEEVFPGGLQEASNGRFSLATYSFMRGGGDARKMVEKAQQKLAPCTQDAYTPPGGWTQEPDDFNSLKLGMTKAEVESRITLGKCTAMKHPAQDTPIEEDFLYDTTLDVGGLALSGEVFFVKDRLINISAKFDKSLWDAVKSAFIDLYGRPHCDRREEILNMRLEVDLRRMLDWSGDRMWIRLLDFPDGKNLGRFYFQQSFKAMGAVDADGKVKLGLRAFVGEPVPPPPPPKIEVEHAESKLVFHLPDGTTLDYPRAHPLQIGLKSTWHRGDDGRYVYYLDVDPSFLSRIAIGGACDWRLTTGWEAAVVADDSGHVAASGETARFSTTSDMLPGPMPINLSKEAKQSLPIHWRSPGWSAAQPPWPIPVTLPRQLYDAVLETLNQQAVFLNNRFIIGPAIAPNSTEVDLRQLAQMWSDHYGFDFLKPALHGNGVLSTELEQLRPSTEFERQIVDCLREAVREDHS